MLAKSGFYDTQTARCAHTTRRFLGRATPCQVKCVSHKCRNARAYNPNLLYSEKASSTTTPTRRKIYKLPSMADHDRALGEDSVRSSDERDEEVVMEGSFPRNDPLEKHSHPNPPLETHQQPIPIDLPPYMASKDTVPKLYRVVYRRKMVFGPYMPVPPTPPIMMFKTAITPYQGRERK